MSRRTRSAFAILPIAALFALTGCSPEGSGGTGSGDPSADPGDGGTTGATLAECVVGTWNADLDDLATQMGAYMSGNGLNVTSSTAEGAQSIVIDDSTLGFANAMSFTITIAMDESLEMAVKQAHAGDVTASYTLDGDVMTFDEFSDAAYTVKTTVSINGREAEAPVKLPSTSAGNVPTTVTCSGDTLTMAPKESPFTTTWHRA